ncbi:signal peptidase I [Calidifontibacter terrae]
MTDDAQEPRDTDAASPDEGYAPGEVPTRAEVHGKKRRGNALQEFVVIAAIALLISFMVKTFLAQPFYIPSESMENTLDVGDRIVVSKFTPQHAPLHRGDVIVFVQPTTWGPPGPENSNALVRGLKDALTFVGVLPGGGQHVVKRLIGLPGDKVACVNDKLQVNGTTLEETAYLKAGSHPCGTPFTITVPQGKVWVMGDNRDNSYDSRGHDDGTGVPGSVPEKDITGEVVAIAWPVGRVQSVDSHPEVFSKVK